MTRAINKEDYKILLKLDKKVYPTSKPVTIKILNQWYQKNPEFGIIFEEKILKKSSDYLEYCTKVKYRIIPFIF